MCKRERERPILFWRSRCNVRRITPAFDPFFVSECPLPSPLWGLDEIMKDNCERYYGTLKIAPRKQLILMPPEMKSKYIWEGCISIINTSLRDIGFLEMFKKFTAAKYCRNGKQVLSIFFCEVSPWDALHPELGNSSCI